jgi:hypothetical protein
MFHPCERFPQCKAAPIGRGISTLIGDVKTKRKPTTMKLVKMNWSPTDRQLRQFGLIALAAFPLLGWLWSAGNITVVYVAAAAGGLLAVVGLLCPRAIKPVFLALSLLAIPIGMLVSEIALGLIFYGLFVPMGLVFRLIGRDALQRKFHREANTYWQHKRQPADAASYLQQW